MAARIAERDPAPFDVRLLGAFAMILKDSPGERLSLSNGISRIDLRLVAGSFLDRPLSLQFLISDAKAQAQVEELHRFRSLRQRRAFGTWLHRREPRAWRWIGQLRAYDALIAGASERDIAEAILGHQRICQEWRDRDGSARSVVRRLVAAARRNVAGGYRNLLSAAN